MTAPSRRASLWLLLGLVLLSANLRPAAVSVGPVLAEVRDGLGMSTPAVGLLTSLPVLAFAVFGALAPAAARLAGVHRVTLVSLLAVVAGLVGRAVTHSEAVFLVLSMLALGGMAMANVLIPSLVKLHFPDRIGMVTAIYTTALAVGLTAALVLTVPISEAFGGWRVGLATWAVVALVAALPWLGLIAHDQAMEAAPRSIRFGDVARTRLGLAMALLLRPPVDARLRHLRLVRAALARQRLLRRAGRRPASVASPRCRSRCRCGRPRRWPGGRTSAGSCSRSCSATPSATSG